MEKGETSSSINSGGSSSKSVSSICTKCLLYVFSICTKCLLYVFHIFRGQQHSASSSVGDMSAKIDTVFDCVIPYIHDDNDRNSLSSVCRNWYELDSLTRKHVTVHMYYATTSSRLLQRFPFIESLTLKGGPLCFREKLNIDIAPWIHQIDVSFIFLKAVHLRSMIVSDSDIELLVISRGKELRVLKITRCEGFSTDGLLHIGKYCNDLRSLCLEANKVKVRDGKWLHELALRSKCIESLNFYLTLLHYNVEDLVLLAKNCSQSLVSVKIPSGHDLRDFFRFAVKLKDFGRANFGYVRDVENVGFQFPPELRCIAFNFMTKATFPVVLPFAHRLMELDLRRACLTEEDHCFLVQKCPNLEVLYTFSSSNRELQFIGRFCVKLRKLKVNIRFPLRGFLSHWGLIALALGCPELEYLHIEVLDIVNEAFRCIGDHLKNLRDFHIHLNNDKMSITDLPLDNGVQALLIGCSKLERLYIHLRPGALTDVGLGYIGKYGRNLRYMFLGYVGESDAGLLELSKGCPKLRKLEIRGCSFSEQALASFVSSVTSLRYLWVHGIRSGEVLFAMTRTIF